MLVGDIKLTLVAVGLLEVEKPDVLVEALFDVASEAPPFHVKVLPFAIVATKTSPKLSIDQSPGSKETKEAPYCNTPTIIVRGISGGCSVIMSCCSRA